MRQGVNPKVGLLVVHGMGSQECDFWKPLDRALRRALGLVSDRVATYPVYWAKAVEEDERKLFAQMGQARDPEGERVALRWQRLRRFIVHGFADALAYNRPPPPADARSGSSPHRRSSVYERVHDILEREVDALYAKLGSTTPVVVMAHSLGAHVASNYIWDSEESPPAHMPDCDGSCVKARSGRSRPRWRPIPTLAGMITFGANIPLFSLAYGTAEPIVLPGGKLEPEPLREYAAWLNLLDGDDVLGWPVRPLYDPRAQAVARTTARERELPRSRAASLGAPSRSPDEPAASEEVAPEPMHCRRRETVRRIQDLPIDAGPFPRNLTPLSHGEYWTDPGLIRPAAAYLRGLIERLDAAG